MNYFSESQVLAVFREKDLAFSCSAKLIFG